MLLPTRELFPDALWERDCNPSSRPFFCSPPAVMNNGEKINEISV